MYTVTLDIIPRSNHVFSYKDVSKRNSVIDCKKIKLWIKKQGRPIIINISDFSNIYSKHTCGDRNLQFIFPIRGYPRIVY